MLKAWVIFFIPTKRKSLFSRKTNQTNRSTPKTPASRAQSRHGKRGFFYSYQTILNPASPLSLLAEIGQTQRSRGLILALLAQGGDHQHDDGDQIGQGAEHFLHLT